MITEWTAEEMRTGLDDLSGILHACVLDGASVGFILPHDLSDARAFWQGLLAQVQSGARRLFVAVEEGHAVGVTTLITAMPDNQPHRGEVSKLLVHPDHRRKGLARQLMQQLEMTARDMGKGLLTLDTRTGDNAEPLYRDLGYQTAGVIPGYCLDAGGQHLDSTTYMFKPLSA
jgi:ribosomal protein S18 acetylase RimI-like enzyme